MSVTPNAEEKIMDSFDLSRTGWAMTGMEAWNNCS